MTYEYACTACGHAWEAEQSISAAPLTECPQCHGATAKRQVSGGAGFILKGGGWYADLYSSSGGAKKTEAATSSKEGASTSPAAKTEPASTSTSTTSTSTPSTGPATGASST
jgi:putative FmdB family regulatory protein